MGTSKATAAPSVRTTPGTYFLSLTVENVRCFGPAQTLDLSDGHGHHARWTVILGENGHGKTTLLTCLAHSTGFRHVLRAMSPGTDRDKLGFYGSSLLDLAHGEKSLARGHDDGDARVEAVVISGRLARRTGTICLRINDWSSETDLPADVLVQLFTFNYGASRRMPLGRGLSDHYERVGVFLDDDVALRDPEDWLLKADYNALLRSSDAKRFETFAERIRDTLINILPEVADIRIQAADEPSGSPRVEAKTPDGWVPLRRLGFGYQSQIAWLVDFVSRMFERYPDSPDPLAEPAVVLVDEIDLHMHPRWQRHIIGDLTARCPRTQFIVTAHSPLVVQAAADANIVLLRREGDHVVIDNDPEVLSNWRVDQILTSELFGLESARPPQIEAPLKERRSAREAQADGPGPRAPRHTCSPDR